MTRLATSMAFAAALLVAGVFAARTSGAVAAAADATALQPAGEPEGIQAANESEGIRAFRDVASVLTSPRCLNCHVPDDGPLQGDDNHRHTMLVKRGADGRGTPALRCGTCHQATNAVELHAPPGVDGWRMPPPATPMAWRGLTLSALCRDLRDPAKTAGRTVAQLVEHVSHDHFVQWAWQPGPGRSQPPLTHAQFVARFTTWKEQGAPCPPATAAPEAGR